MKLFKNTKTNQNIITSCYNKKFQEKNFNKKTHDHLVYDNRKTANNWILSKLPNYYDVAKQTYDTISEIVNNQKKPNDLFWPFHNKIKNTYGHYYIEEFNQFCIKNGIHIYVTSKKEFNIYCHDDKMILEVNFLKSTPFLFLITDIKMIQRINTCVNNKSNPSIKIYIRENEIKIYSGKTSNTFEISTDCQQEFDFIENTSPINHHVIDESDKTTSPELENVDNTTMAGDVSKIRFEIGFNTIEIVPTNITTITSAQTLTENNIENMNKEEKIVESCEHDDEDIEFTRYLIARKGKTSYVNKFAIKTEKTKSNIINRRSFRTRERERELANI